MSHLLLKLASLTQLTFDRGFPLMVNMTVQIEL